MKCPNCGAEIEQNSRVCSFCNSPITVEMQRAQEQLNKAGCPRCGSTNISFRRENQGEIRGKNGKAIVHKTIGMCKDCGNTWYTDGGSGSTGQKKKSNMWLWVLGWIFIFPVPLTILLLRNKDMKPAVKYGIIAAAWIVYLLIGFSGRNRNKNQNSQQNTQVSTEVDTAENNTNTETEETAGTNSENNVSHLYDSAEVRDLMNGSGTEKVGEYAVIKASSSDCTEENLADVYFNYFKANDFNYLVIIYSDKNDNSGVYVNSGYIGVDTSFEEDDKGDYSVKSSENETIYYPSDDGKTIEKSTSNDGGDYTFIIDPNEKGDYGFENTLNKGTDSEETQIVYHIPAGTYKVKNLGEYQGQIEACSDNTHVTDEGWEEPEDVKGAVSLEPDEEVEFSIEDGYYLEVHLNGTLGFTEVK